MAVTFLLKRRGARQVSMPSSGRGRRVGTNGVRFWMEFRPHCLQVHQTHVTFAAAQLVSCSALNATLNAQVCALGMASTQGHLRMTLPFKNGRARPARMHPNK